VDREAMFDLVSQLVGFGKTPTVIESNADADAHLAAFPADQPPRHQRPLPLVSSANKRLKKASDEGVAFRFPWSPTARNPVTVSTSDLARLEPEKFLNDTLIDLEIARLHQNIDGTSTQGAHPFIYAFTSQFFTKLSESKSAATTEAQHAQRISRWSRALKVIDPAKFLAS
jgi:Ulp1 family protease